MFIVQPSVHPVRRSKHSPVLSCYPNVLCLADQTNAAITTTAIMTATTTTVAKKSTVTTMIKTATTTSMTTSATLTTTIAKLNKKIFADCQTDQRQTIALVA